MQRLADNDGLARGNRRLGRALGKVLLGLTLALAAAGQAAPTFRFAEVNPQSLGLWEAEKPVLVYNHGVMASPPGVPVEVDRAGSMARARVGSMKPSPRLFNEFHEITGNGGKFVSHPEVVYRL